MANIEISNELLVTIQETQGLKNITQAYAFAWGMASSDLTNEQIQSMINGLKKKAN